MLLAAYNLRRPTRDVDLLAEDVSNDLPAVLALVKDIIAEVRDDGVVYGEPTAEIIRDDAEYSGVRVSIPCILATANIAFSVDVNVGDPVWPSPVPVKITRLLGGEISIRGYPLSMILAEKIVTAVQRRSTNTRWRDFADVYLIAHRHAIVGDELSTSIDKVAQYRKEPMMPLATACAGLEVKGQTKWTIWRRNEQFEHLLPASLAEVLNAVCTFADPLVGGNAKGLDWNPDKQKWHSPGA